MKIQRLHDAAWRSGRLCLKLYLGFPPLVLMEILFPCPFAGTPFGIFLLQLSVPSEVMVVGGGGEGGNECATAAASPIAVAVFIGPRAIATSLASVVTASF